jgi:hypothetical protein
MVILVRRFLLVLLLALSAAVAAPAPAPAANGMEIAIQDDHVFVNQWWFNRETALQRAQALGVTRIRANLGWAKVLGNPKARKRPDDMAYNWLAYDTLIADAARYGISLELTLVGPGPRWATGNRKISQVAPDARAFGRFARDAAAHFAGRVDRYSIWNEPNWHYWLQPSKDCRSGRWAESCDRKVALLYRSLYRQGYRGVKAADPEADVLFGELSPRGRVRTQLSTPPLEFLRTATCSKRNWSAARRCEGLDADGFAQHPYDIDAGPTDPAPNADDVTLSSLNRLVVALRRLARRGALETPRGRQLDLYLTEHGYMRGGRFKVPAKVHARYLTKSFQIALEHPRVKQMLQYLLVQPPKGRDTFPSHLLGRKGQVSRPYKALQQWVKRNRRRLARPLAAPAAPVPAAPVPAAPAGTATPPLTSLPLLP